jgi:glucosamine-6-phosphate deaminase
MEVVIVDDPAAIGVIVADAVVSLIRRKPAAVLGLATGASPLPVYDELVRRRVAGDVSFAAAWGFCLDEYVGLAPDHPEAYRSVIRRVFADRAGLAGVRAPDGSAPDLPTAAAEFEAAIASAGGIDLQLLGIGADGHIGFNEPGSSLGSRTRLKTLTARTRADNARFFGPGEEVPHHVLTQGIATILEARHIILVAAGAAKTAPIAAAVEGPLTAMVPASALQLHPHTSVVIDEAAAAGLRLATYYRETFAGKPTWQGL